MYIFTYLFAKKHIAHEDYIDWIREEVRQIKFFYIFIFKIRKNSSYTYINRIYEPVMDALKKFV